MKKIWIILLGIAMITATIGVIMIKHKEDNYIYEPDYFTKLGLSYHKYRYQYEYTTMIQDFGEPTKIEVKDGSTYCIYPELYFMYDGEHDKNSMIHHNAFNVTVTSDKYRIGKENIGIGSTRVEVEKVYRKSIFSSVENDSTGYRDGRSNDEQWVEYYFDKNDRVRAITLGLSV